MDIDEMVKNQEMETKSKLLEEMGNLINTIKKTYSNKPLRQLMITDLDAINDHLFHVCQIIKE